MDHRRLSTIALALGALGLLVGCSGDDAQRDDQGAIVEAADELGVFNLRVGDCFQDPRSDETEVIDVAAVPCSEPHDNEVFFAFDVEGDDYPGDAAVRKIADERCAAEFESFVGTDYDTSEYYVSSLFPSETGWKEIDDREVLCILYLDGEQMTGSARGTNR